MMKYYARICWNTRGWIAPSGDAKNLERGTYATRNGFGHEEWLFNFTWLLDGYHYAFLQGVNSSSSKLKGETTDVILWGITPEKRHVYIGQIGKCKLLSEDESLKARRAHIRAGWLDLMRQDVVDVHGNSNKLLTDSAFNIRFRPADAIQFDDPLPIARPSDRISRLKRYSLVPAQHVGSTKKLSGGQKRRGSMTLPRVGAHYRAGAKGGTVDPYHPVLQRALMRLLQNRFGAKNVLREDGWVDLTAQHKKRKLLIELKTDPVAKRAIREAMGQILEYAYLKPKRDGLNLELFIVAPGAIDDEAAAYLKRLNDQFAIPIRYCQFLPNGDLPTAFLQPLP